MIGKADRKDLAQISALAEALWPGHGSGELAADFEVLLEQPEAAVFLAWEGERAVGFAQCQLRHDYVEGTEHSPVGYLEGIFVEEAFRCRGIGKALLRACEDWARSRGCTEFASDCELTNIRSHFFHGALGFREANRIVCYVKQL